jgi:signal transduction histidine kinase
MDGADSLRDQLASLHDIAVEIAALRDMSLIHDRALGYCLDLTGSQYAFTGLLPEGPGRQAKMDVAAVKGFVPSSPEFYAQFHLMAVRASVVGDTILEERSMISNDVQADPHSVGQPPGHPPVRRFLGVPLRVGTKIIGMIGVANKRDDYVEDDERLLSTFASQVAVAYDHARLHEEQREMISGLQRLHERLSEVERVRLLTRERQRIAGRLHDDIEQRIFTMALLLGPLAEDLDMQPRVAEQLRDIQRSAIEAAKKVREGLFALAVPRHPNGELTSDLRSLLVDMMQAGIKGQLVANEAPPAVEGPIRDVLYAVIKEALANVVEHAGASAVLVSIRYEEDRVHAVIQDDGTGASEVMLATYPDSRMHFGLRHSRQQVLDLGGTFDVSNGDEGGLTIRVSIPLGRAAT